MPLNAVPINSFCIPQFQIDIYPNKSEILSKYHKLRVGSRVKFQNPTNLYEKEETQSHLFPSIHLQSTGKRENN